MEGHGNERAMMRALLARLVLAAVVALACLLLVWPTPAHAEISSIDKRCLGCHSRRGLTKGMEDAERLTMVVPADPFAKSEHASLGCAGCHADIKLSTHLQTRKTIKSARDYALASNAVCQKCHEKSFGEWRNSIHAALVHAGHADGPICTSCHPPHSEIKAVPAAIGDVACKTCHATIFAAYATSVHGLARGAGKADSPLCFDCHNAHNVSVASSPTGPKNACLSCHDGVLKSHDTWLPNAALHFDAVSCPVCHVPTAQRRVDLQLVEGGGQNRVSEKAGVPTFGTPGKSVDAIALYNLTQTLGQGSTQGRPTLRGRLEVSTPEQIHQLAAKTQAISSCDTCHSAGSEAFRSVSISVAGPNGLPVRYVADKAVLSSVMSIGSIGGFYAVGGTRIELLDLLLLLAVLAGIGLPAAHLLLGALVRRHLRRHATPPADPRNG